VLSLIDPSDRFEPKSLLFWSDVAGALRPRMERLRKTFSEAGNYAELKKRLSDVHEFERAVIRQSETEINRKLYPDS
jgi:hypothetical protein